MNHDQVSAEARLVAVEDWQRLGFTEEEAWAIGDATELLCIAEASGLVTAEQATQICDEISDELRAVRLQRSTV